MTLPARLRSPAAWAVAGGVVSIVLALLRFDPFLFIGGDNAVYYALARALATGEGYVSLHLPGAPPHTLYPPGFPALLVPVHWATGGSLAAMKFVPLLAGALLLWATWRIGRLDPAVPGWAAAAAVWAVGLYPVVQTYVHRVLSDLPYTALAVASLAVLQRAATGRDGSVKSGDPAGPETGPEARAPARAPADRLDRPWLIGCALALAAFWVRVPGVTLLGAIVLWALLRRHWKRAAAAAVLFAAGTLPWFLWSRLQVATTDAEVEYLGQVSEMAGEPGVAVEMAENLRRAFVEYGTYQFPHLFWPTDPAPDPVRAAGLVLGAAAVAWGIWRAIRARGALSPWEVYVPATLAVLPVWPWLGDRFFLTVAPMLWLWILVGLDDASRRFARGPAPAIAAVALVCALLLGARAREVPERIALTRAWAAGDLLAGYDLYWRDYFEAARWMRTNVPEDAVVLARKPGLAWYWSRRPVEVGPYFVDGPPQWPMIREAGVTHVLLDPWGESHYAETLAAHRDALSVAFRTGSGQVVVLAVAPE